MCQIARPGHMWGKSDSLTELEVSPAVHRWNLVDFHRKPRKHTHFDHARWREFISTRHLNASVQLSAGPSIFPTQNYQRSLSHIKNDVRWARGCEVTNAQSRAHRHDARLLESAVYISLTWPRTHIASPLSTVDASFIAPPPPQFTRHLQRVSCGGAALARAASRSRRTSLNTTPRTRAAQ